MRALFVWLICIITLLIVIAVCAYFQWKHSRSQLSYKSWVTTRVWKWTMCYRLVRTTVRCYDHSVGSTILKKQHTGEYELYDVFRWWYVLLDCVSHSLDHSNGGRRLLRKRSFISSAKNGRGCSIVENCCLEYLVSIVESGRFILYRLYCKDLLR